MAVGGGSLGSIRGTIKIDYDGAGIAKATKDTENLTKTGGKTGEAMGKLSTLALGTGVAIAAGFAVAVNSAANFEKGLSNIQAVSGATTGEMDKIRKKALQLGADTKFSAGEAAQAMEELAKAGVSTTDILNGAADATVNLAAAGDIALPEAATIMSNAMNQFGLSAKDLPRITDLIAGAANASAIDVSQFGYSLSQVGAVAKLAGLSFDDTAVAIAELGNAGIVGSDAGTSLKTFLNNLIPTTKQQIALSQQLGLMTKDGTNAFFDQNGKVKSLAEVSQILQNATKNLTKEQKLAAFQTLFGSDAIRAAAVLADNGAAGFNNLAGSMDKVKAADVAKTKMDNFSGSLEQLKGSLETLAISLGSILLPPLKTSADQATRVVNAFQGLDGQTQKTILTVLGVAAGILIFVGVVYKIIQVVKAFQVVWTALNASFLFSPVGLVILAIIALIAVIVLIATKTTWFQSIWSAVWGFMQAVGAWFAGPFAGFFVSLWNTVWPVIKGIGDFFVAIWNFVVGAVTFYIGIIMSVVNFLAPFFSAVFNLIWSIISTVWAAIGAVIAVGVALWKGIIIPVLNFIWGFIMFVLNGIFAFWSFMWNLYVSVITAVWGFIGPYVMGAMNLIWGIIQRVLSVIGAIWSAIWNTIKSVASAVWNAITSIISAAVSRVVSIINGIKAVVDKVRAFFNQLKDAASGGVGSLISFVGGIPGRIIGALGDVGSMLYNSGKRIIEGLISGIRDMAGRVADAVNSVMDKARNLLPFSPAKEGPFSGKGWTLYSGQSMMDGLADGIDKRSDRAVKAMNDALAAMAGGSSINGLFALSTGATAPTATPRNDGRPPTPPIYVIADFGKAGRQMVRHEIVDNPNLVSSSARAGDAYRKFITPGGDS